MEELSNINRQFRHLITENAQLQILARLALVQLEIKELRALMDVYRSEFLRLTAKPGGAAEHAPAPQ